MMQSDREKIQTTTNLEIIIKRIMAGARKPRSSRRSLIAWIIVLTAEFVFCCRHYTPSYMDYFGKNHNSIYGWIALFIAIDILLLYLSGTPAYRNFTHGNGYRKIGLVNSAMEAPTLLTATRYNKEWIYEYLANGIPLSSFIDKSEFIEAALNIVILDIRQGTDRTRIIITAKDGKNQLPDYVEWDNSYLSKSDGVIALGINNSGVKTVNLNITPHIACGGITGSGKSILLSCCLNQLYQQGAIIYLVDFKGLIDFSKRERELYRCVTTKPELLNLLKELVEEMESRKRLLSETECANVIEYNQQHPEKPLPRIIVASDEIAFAFMKKGLSKEDKEIVESIELYMSILATQSRFANINLWLSTQRADADTIPPQIRSNLTVRLCGRASEILSRVTIDSTIAKEIPARLRGRFVDDTEDFFQAFYYKEVH